MARLRAFFCREYRDYVLFGVEFLAEICQKFSEILRILAEILRKKLATGASGRAAEGISVQNLYGSPFLATLWCKLLYDCHFSITDLGYKHIQW